MASIVYILDLKGKNIIARDYRGDVPLNIIEKFNKLVLDEDDANIKPIFEHSGVSFAHIKYNNIYLVAVTRANANAMALLVFLYKLIDVFKLYFKEVEEESIRDNFVVVYELLDEMMDYGYPQYSEPKVLQEYITQESYTLERGEEQKEQKLPSAVTGDIGWRSPGIFYRKNEVFLDVVESVNILVASNGTVLRSEIQGALKMRTFLSGMPELKLGLNDKVLFQNMGKSVTKGRAVELEDMKFHQCVRLQKFESERTISFVPPDGDFELMSYRLNTRVKPLIWIEAVIEPHSRSRIEYSVKAKAQFKRRSTANNVEIHIPVPSDADSPSFKTTMGTVRYAPEKNCIIWQIKQFPGGKEFVMRAQIGLPSIEAEEADNSDTKRPITVKFEIPYFTVSGLQVRYLKIMENKFGYQALPWVRYITQSGDYILRMS